MHHIFPKAQLYKQKPAYKRPEVNAIANFCFLTKETNLEISDKKPEEYFAKYEAKHSGVLASQWIPMDEDCGKSKTTAIFSKLESDCWRRRRTPSWLSSTTDRCPIWR